MAKRTIPAISIVIPMYNTEKYVGECLDSILAQTFDDYEVIVVDDRSTDGSAAVVESYIPKFKNKLQLERLKVNSGGGTTRNVGMKIAQGKYVMFVDSDDAISETALEELYAIAEKFDADVVTCEKWYQTPMNGNIFDKDLLKIIGPPAIERVNEPTLVADDMAKRVTDLSRYQFAWNVWSKLIRRDFLIQNDITIINAVGEDAVFTCCLLCSGAKFVRVPNIVNFYRVHENSFFREGQDDIAKSVKKWMNSLKKGFNYLDEFLNRQNFFRQHPDIKHIVLEIIVREFCAYFVKFYTEMPAHQLNQLVRAELETCENLPALAAFLFGRMNLLNVNLTQQQSLVRQQQAKIQKAKEYLIIQRQQIQELQAQIQQPQK